MGIMRSLTPQDVLHRIENAGYYPDLVADALEIAVAGEQVSAHLVHGETTFDVETVRRHLSVLVLTATRLVFVHADDHGGDEHGVEAHAIVSSEAVPLSAVGSVMVTHVVTDPAQYRPGRLGSEITLTVSWGGVSRVDLEPATCGDPQCEADHGYTGSLTGDDLSLRISAQADGDDDLAEAVRFARELSAATVGARR